MITLQGFVLWGCVLQAIDSLLASHQLYIVLQIKTMAKELDIAFLTVGFDPKWAVADVPIMPKNRYK